MGSIRPYDSKRDRAILDRMHVECYPEGYSAENDNANHHAAESPSWVYEYHGLVAGCLISEVKEGQPYLWSVCVRELFRGRGIAGDLLRRFEQEFRDARYQPRFKRLWLNVRQNNPAQKLYFDHGYRVVGCERNMYGERQHGLVMQKAL